MLKHIPVFLEVKKIVYLEARQLISVQEYA